MHIHDAAPYVLLPAVTQEVELGSVHPKDGAVRANPVQADRSILKEVVEIPLAAMQLVLGLLQVLDI
jgi:hypothetical protein